MRLLEQDIKNVQKYFGIVERRAKTIAEATEKEGLQHNQRRRLRWIRRGYVLQDKYHHQKKSKPIPSIVNPSTNQSNKSTVSTLTSTFGEPDAYTGGTHAKNKMTKVKAPAIIQLNSFFTISPTKNRA